MGNSIAIVFPGQGSQSIGMMKGFDSYSALIKPLFQEASELLGYDLAKLIQDGPDTLLNQTIYTQPAMLVCDIACFKIWQENTQNSPAIFAGHSLGEYAALVSAEAIDFADALSLVNLRAKLMQDAVPEGKGAMAAILGLSEEVIISLCQKISTVENIVEPANFNAPGQIVIAGHAKAIDQAIALAKSAGAKRAIKLPVSIPSHCSLMQIISGPFREAIKSITIKTPEAGIIQNITGELSRDPETLREGLVRQLYSSVQWIKTINTIAAENTRVIIECGPGNILTALNRRINNTIDAVNIKEYIAS